jgi:pyrroloquinoline quinone biosynthesis protein E
MALTGDPRNADPVCHLSPHHDRVEAIVSEDTSDAMPDYVYRRMQRVPAPA